MRARAGPSKRISPERCALGLSAQDALWPWLQQLEDLQGVCPPRAAILGASAAPGVPKFISLCLSLGELAGPGKVGATL